MTNNLAPKRIGIIGFLLVACAATLFSQIRINEKIVITPKLRGTNNPGDGGEGPTGGVSSGLVMPKKGMLQVYYAYANRFFSWTPDSVMLYANPSSTVAGRK